MADLNRFLNNIRNYDREFADFMSCCRQKYKNIGATTPIPNQALPTLYNNLGKEAELVFDKPAYYMLNKIRNLNERFEVLSKKNKSIHIPIKFICTGYRDKNGDIVIDNITCPIFEHLSQKFKSTQQINEYITTHYSELSQLNKYINFDGYDYLMHGTVGTQPIGTHIVSLIGQTRPQNNIGELINCCKMSELAEATMPNEPVADNIISGTLLITPDTFAKDSTDKSGNSLKRIPGSLECTIISYIKSPNTSKTVPIRLDNIVKSWGFTADEQRENIAISQSPQDLSGLPSMPDARTFEDMSM